MLRYYQKEKIAIGDNASLYMQEQFINEDGIIIKPSDLTFLGSGENSTVWRYQDQALKIFLEDRKMFALSYYTYLKTKDLPLKRILKAKDVYKVHLCSQPINAFDAYLMEYQQKEYFSLLDIETALLLKNFQLIENDAKILAEVGIEINDTTILNSIINTSHELYISDIDLYSVAINKTFVEILAHNMVEINYFILAYLKKELKTLEQQEELSTCGAHTANSKLNDIFMGYLPKIIASNELEKLFSNYENPKEYFLSLSNKR